ncbi:MAG: glycine--tRNA ligase [Candidatus Yanofskybacteria bacterium CG10_big_fil_rev_8_21_14_0_10_36_16]|uniref:Glycine--tRNA ligase n=1 Tax=Candidatus Yanofskybacteria bacterium CG10_big_fil_rev_8_21_14_0_10_36_16 TaxID=1975096 RepID=A0A2J0QBH5_9BACT|nr:MAG: glycine--tRNA ligase [Candidatus Yanofskybacteria bacterium CG10_big_fil_rev_8_21_14_0_10_36_16]
MSKEKNNNLIDTITSLAKRRGFVYPGSEIYGGLANSWDYGPLGVELKNNLRDWWWKRFVQSRRDMVGLDAAILMNPKVWEASGHVSSFSDAMVDCKKCKTRHRADHLIENALPDQKVEGKSADELSEIIETHKIACPKCGAKGEFTKARKFNLLFQTSIGSVEGDKSVVYLRGEVAQSMFVNFKNVLDTTRIRLPFGIASVGKVFRNEITPGNFTFRTLEFDLMEFEYFIEKNDWQKWFEYWLAQQQDWLKEIGFNKDNLRVREHEKEELSHYSNRTADIEYKTPIGWKELFGLAYRTDFDLKNHSKHSGVDLEYTDPESGNKFTPHVIEPTFGLTRLMLMVMLEFYYEEGEGNDKRVVLKLHPKLAPYKVAVFPLLKNKPELVKKAQEIFDNLSSEFTTVWDDRGNVGKRYYAQDEIGTPWCVTVDFDSLEDGTVTVRDRDTAKQERIKIDELSSYFSDKLK